MTHLLTQQRERLGLLSLYGLERGSGPGEGIYQGRLRYIRGQGQRRCPAWRVLGLKEAHGLCWSQESGSNLLHEQSSTGSYSNLLLNGI